MSLAIHVSITNNHLDKDELKGGDFGLITGKAILRAVSGKFSRILKFCQVKHTL